MDKKNLWNKQFLLHTLVILDSLFIRFVTGFNLDVKNSVVEFSDNDTESFFGASVAFMNMSGKRTVSVGSPFGGKRRSGVVFVCDWLDEKCRQLPEPQIKTSDQFKLNRTRQLLGMTLASSNNYLLANAPGYNGYGIIYNNQSIAQEFDLKATGDTTDTTGDYQYLIAGFSTTSIMFNGNSIFFLGIPGSITDSGGLFAIYSHKSHYAGELSDRIGDRLGYSVCASKFKVNSTKSKELPGIMAGAPYRNEMNGTIRVFTFNVKVNCGRCSKYAKICDDVDNPDEQIGSYFGASVCAVDLNNDGKDDMLVGAPLYTTSRQDEGRVYVYMHNSTHNSSTTMNCYDQSMMVVLKGETEGGRFGATITNIGDINGDGYHDVAIGAPNGGPDKRGAVYIYLGSKGGIITKASQEIYSRDMPNGGGTGFGYSIAGGSDIDGNQYPDVAVGALQDSKVYLIRSRPVIRLRSEISASEQFVPIYADQKFDCGPKHLTSYRCLSLSLNLSYYGKQTPVNLTLHVTIKLDTTKSTGKRAIFTSNQRSFILENVTLTKEQNTTLTMKFAVLANRDLDVTNPIEIRASYTEFVHESQCPERLCAILDEYKRTDTPFQIGYRDYCQNNFDETCTHKLNINSTVQSPRYTTLKQIVYGRISTIYFVVLVTNDGGDAFRANLELNFHSDLAIDRISINTERLANYEAAKDIGSGANQLIFPLVDVFPKDQTYEIEVRFSFSKQHPTIDKYVFFASVTALGNNTGTMNMEEFEVDVKVETCITVSEDAKPAHYKYGAGIVESPVPSKDIGSEVLLTFFVQNTGKVPVKNLQADILVPVKKNNLDFIHVVNLTAEGNNCNLRRPSSTSDMEVFRCTFDEIDNNKGVKVLMTTRFAEEELPRINFQGDVEIPINLSFTGQDWYIRSKKANCTLEATGVVTLLRQESEEKIPVWWIVLPVIGALFILCVAIFALYKIGFFKRNRGAPIIEEEKASEDEDDQEDIDVPSI